MYRLSQLLERERLVVSADFSICEPVKITELFNSNQPYLLNRQGS